MAGNNSIQFLRGTRNQIAQNTQQLQDGQPLYNTTDNYLSIGGGGSNDLSKLPIACRELKGYVTDLSNQINSVTNTTEQWSIKYEAGKGLQVNNSVYVDKDITVQHNTLPYTSNLKNTTLQSATATGIQSIAFGGKSYRKSFDPSRTPTSATGHQAFAFGGSCHALGGFSFAGGKDNNSYQGGSFTIGGGNKAGMTEEEFNAYWWDSANETALNGGKGKKDGKILDDEGYNYENSYSFAVAMGSLSEAKGWGSWAFGEGVKALARNSYATGLETVAEGSRGFAAGYKSKAKNTNAFAIGEDTSAEGVNSFAAGYTTKATNFAATSLGENTQANGKGSLAAGFYSQANGEYAVSLGYGCIAGGEATVTLGKGNQTTKAGQIVVGTYADTTTRSDEKFIVGIGTSKTDTKNGFSVLDSGKAILANSLKIGSSCTISKDYSLAVGTKAQADANNSVALGEETYTSKNRAFAAGYKSRATNINAFAIGEETLASGVNSFASGYAGQATGTASAKFGEYSQANGQCSFAAGYGCVAGGQNSVAIGTGNKTTINNQTVLGTYAEENTSSAIFVVGNGSSKDNRHNALEVGNNWIHIENSTEFSTTSNFVYDGFETVYEKRKQILYSKTAHIDGSHIIVGDNSLSSTELNSGSVYLPLQKRVYDSHSGNTTYSWYWQNIDTLKQRIVVYSASIGDYGRGTLVCFGAPSKAAVFAIFMSSSGSMLIGKRNTNGKFQRSSLTSTGFETEQNVTIHSGGTNYFWLPPFNF